MFVAKYPQKQIFINKRLQRFFITSVSKIGLKVPIYDEKAVDVFKQM